MKKLIFIGLFVSMLVTWRFADAADKWVPASPPTSCAEICKNPITSGKDRHGYSFYVCRGRTANGEWRPGFNISTSSDSARKCLFEFGGRRGESKRYDCLCRSSRSN